MWKNFEISVVFGYSYVLRHWRWLHWICDYWMWVTISCVFEFQWVVICRYLIIRLISTTGAWLLMWHSSSKLQVKEVAREKSNGYYLINLPKNLNVFHWNIVDLNYYYYYFDNNVLSAFLLSFKCCKFKVIWRFFFFFFFLNMFYAIVNFPIDDKC